MKVRNSAVADVGSQGSSGRFGLDTCRWPGTRAERQLAKSANSHFRLPIPDVHA